jgi:DNA-binding CsgD family transcriptional regulator
MQRDELIDQIYECSFVGQNWPRLLDELANYAGAVGGFLFSFDPSVGVLRSITSDSFRDHVDAYVGGDWMLRDARTRRMWAANYGGFLSEMDVFTSEELESDPTYKNFYEPRGIGRAMITAIFPPMGPTLLLGVERSYADGPTSRERVLSLNEIRPHLARAAMMASRLQFERAQAAAEVLGALGLPALIFGHRGVVMAANGPIQELSETIRWLAADRFALVDAGAEQMLRRAIGSLDRNDLAVPCSFAVRGASSQAAMVAHVVPVRGSARDVLVHSTGVLVLTPVTRPDAPPVELIQSLFDLTPAEAKVARSLVAGDTLEEIAAASNLSRNTIRSQVRGALEKTGSRRQADLVALLGGITLRPK